MPTIERVPNRERILVRIKTAEFRLAKNIDADSVEESIAHATLQIQYWRQRQVLASMDAESTDLDVVKAARYECRKCSEQAAEWERRKADSQRLTIGALLEELARKIDSMANAGNALGEIATG